MKYLPLFCLLLAACASKGKYDPSKNLATSEKDSVLASIITYIYDAPPYTSMKDRFKPEHRKYYIGLTSRFSFDQYYVSEKGLSYYYVLRPGPKVGETRGVGGFFELTNNFQLKNFREIFVTPVMSESDAKTKGEFLFDKMVKGEIDEYLKMKTFVQWPNPASKYDTVIYQWGLRLPK
jgi:hypothetical protein